MTLLVTLLSIIWIYGGAYAAALATASSFYALFFFFWTRTGDRINKIDKTTKKIYLHSIYNVLRFSLYALVGIKFLEVALVTTQLQSAQLPVSVWDVLLSQNGLFIYLLLILIAINSIAMQRRWINFAFGLPFAVVSYFFLFLHMTSRQAFSNPLGFVTPAGEVFLIDVIIYLFALVVGTVIFNYFSEKVRKNTGELKNK